YRNLAEKLPSGASMIYTFENQPWEKMLNLALGKNFKKIAYQHTIIQANYLDYRVSVFEKGSPAPDVILASGNKWLDFLKEYYPHCQMENAGAVRLGHIFSSSRNRRLGKDKIIVVALSMVSEVSISLQRQVLGCLAAGEFNGYKFLIKPHPYLLKSDLLTEEFLRYDNCIVTEKGMEQLLEDCCLLVTSGSTVAFEALAFGVKTLYFIPEAVSVGNEYFIRDYLELAFADDFNEKLLTALKSTECPKFNVKEFFSPPDYSVFLKHATHGIG
ncbi:MAG: hypothetical protein PHG51_06070, partial [Candidatus Omnitrophica bacterium]|nr:hypothetical protein [Candidatus Omnitrophota bacterium]